MNLRIIHRLDKIHKLLVDIDLSKRVDRQLVHLEGLDKALRCDQNLIQTIYKNQI